MTIHNSIYNFSDKSKPETNMSDYCKYSHIENIDQ